MTIKKIPISGENFEFSNDFVQSLAIYNIIIPAKNPLYSRSRQYSRKNILFDKINKCLQKN